MAAIAKKKETAQKQPMARAMRTRKTMMTANSPPRPARKMTSLIAKKTTKTPKKILKKMRLIRKKTTKLPKKTLKILRKTMQILKKKLKILRKTPAIQKTIAKKRPATRQMKKMATTTVTKILNP